LRLSLTFLLQLALLPAFLTSIPEVPSKTWYTRQSPC
jgi:hypothetical protein